MPLLVLAQPGTGGDVVDNGPSMGAPFDGGVSILIAGSLLYGV